MEVNVTKRIVTQVWDRYCPVVVNSSGRIKADWVIVDGHQEKHPGGSYYLEWRERGQRKRLSVGRDTTVAFNSQIRKTKELEARAEGLDVKAPKDDPNRFQLRSAMADFLEEIKLSRQDKTWQGYKVSFAYFLQSCDKKCVNDVQRIDLLRFCAFLRNRKKLSPRTVFNKFTCVMTFLEAQGLPKLLDELVDNDRPTNKDRYARNSSWPGALSSTKGRIHLRRLVFSTLAFSLQSDGGPYIFGHVESPPLEIGEHCGVYGIRDLSILGCVD